MEETKRYVTFRESHQSKALYFTLVQGIEAFNRGDFYAARAAWEEVWQSVTGKWRDLFRGLVYIASGLYHWSNANPLRALRQLQKGQSRLQQFPATFMGLHLGELLHQLEPFLACLDRIVQAPQELEQFHPMQYSFRYPHFEWEVPVVRDAFGLGQADQEDTLR